MLERLRFQAAAGAGGVRVGGPPSGVSGQVTLPGSHLVDSSRGELVEPHERARIQGGRVIVIVIARGGKEAGPLIKEGLSHSLPQGGVGVRH